MAVDRARDLGCDTFQIFTRNPRSWAYRPLDKDIVEAFIEKTRNSGITPIFGHMPYILNLASPSETIYSRSIESLSAELGRCSALGIPMLVTHLGSHMGKGSREGVRRVTQALNWALETEENNVTILLENGSGSRNKLGSRFEGLKSIMNGIHEKERVKICLDTCHAFVAGYELRTPQGLETTLKKIDETIGLNNLRLIHLNDSVGDIGSGHDHHEHIGLGKIGLEGFKLILKSRLSKLPIIMETPINGGRTDLDNMRLVRRLADT
jgi:deoxyribonuclease-4